MKARLQKILAGRGIASRRHAELLISEGRVVVNGQVVRTPGTLADPDVDSILLDGLPLPAARPPRVLMLNKPVGFLCTSIVDREHGDSVLDLVPSDRRYFTVGRLDRDSSGLILLTDDGDLANRLMHPRYGTRKVYRVATEPRLTDEQMNALVRGVELDDGHARALSITRAGREAVRMVMAEGRKREVRRMLEAVGARVTGLRREQVGGLKIGDLAPGEWRELNRDEIELLLRENRSLGGAES